MEIEAHIESVLSGIFRVKIVAKNTLLGSRETHFMFMRINDTQGKTCALLNSVQKFIAIQGWLLLTFFICLHNQLSSFNSIIVQMSEKHDSSNRQ